MLLNKNGKNKPSVVATMIAENIAAAKARIIWIDDMLFSGVLNPSIMAQANQPIIPQLTATSKAIRTSLLKTWLSLNAAKCPVARPDTTIADVCRPALPLIAAIMGTNATAVTYT